MQQGLRAAMATLVLLVIVTSAVVAQEPGVRILAGDSIKAEVPEAGGPLTVSVINGTAGPQSITVEVTGIPGVTVVPVPNDFAPNEQKLVSVAIPAVKAGDYTASLAAFGTDGSSDARTLTLSVTVAPATAPPSAPPGTISNPLPPKVFMSADMRLPTPLTNLDLTWQEQPIVNGPIGSPSVPIDPTIADDVQSGLVASDNGQRAMLRTEGNNLIVESLTAAGQYDGNLQVGTGDKAETVPVSLIARDHVVYALGVLVIGLVVATFIHDFVTRGRPANSLRILLLELTQKAEVKQVEGRDWIGHKDQGDVRRLLGSFEPFVIFVRSPGPGRCAGILADDREAALAVFRDTGNPDERAKTWSRDGTGYKAVAGRLDKLDDLYRAVHDVARKYVAIDATLTEPADKAAFGATPTAGAAREAVKGKVLCNEADLNKASTALADALAWLSAYQKLVDSYAVILAAMPGNPSGDQKKAVKIARDSLFSPLHRSAEDLKKVGPLLDTAFAAVIGGNRRADPAVVAAAAADPVLETTLESLRARQTSEIGAMRSSASRANLLFNGLTALIAVGSGLVLYFSNASFGATGDYLGLLVWATVTTEAVTFARRFAPLGLG
jgi:hypothetical protein